MREKVSCQVKHIKIELLVLRLVFLVKGHTKKKKEERSKRTVVVNKYTPPKPGSIPAAAAPKSSQSCPTLCDPREMAAHQAPPFMGFSRQEY